jgi:hypothetical protein
VYAPTGDGTYDPENQVYGNGLIAVRLERDRLPMKDYFIPSNWAWMRKRDLDMNVTPVVFPYKGRELLVGSGKEGRFFLLDSQSLGGTDHRTPLFRSDLISNEDIDFAGAGTWGSLSSWEDAQGTRWVLAPVWGPKHPSATFAMNNGDANVGSIAAFKVEEKGGKPVLTNAWISRNLMTPAAPAVANGVVFALASGEWVRQANDREGGLYQVDARVQRSQPAILYALDAATGKELWRTDKVTELSSGGSIHLTTNGENTFLYTDRGELIVASLSGHEYKEISRAALLEPTYPLDGRKFAWVPPAYANRCVFARNDKELVCAFLAE